MSDTKEGASKFKELEARKLALIEKYMKMQDEADDLNERIYQTCCEVEALNLTITKAKEEEDATPTYFLKVGPGEFLKVRPSSDDK